MMSYHLLVRCAEVIQVRIAIASIALVLVNVPEAAAQPLDTPAYRHEQIQIGSASVPALLDSHSNLVSLLQKPWEHGIIVPLSADAARGEERALEAAGRAFLEQHQHILGIPLAEIGPARIIEHDDGWSITFNQQFRGVSVRGTQIGITVGKKGTLLSFGVDAVPGIELSTAPTISDGRAEELALMHFGPGTILRTAPRLLISEYSTSVESVVRLVWQVLVLHSEERLAVDLDAHTGEVLNEYSTVRHFSSGGQRGAETVDHLLLSAKSSHAASSLAFTASGRVRFDHWTRATSSDGFEGFAQSRVRLLDPSGTPVDSTLTNSNGYYSISYPDQN